MGSSDNAGIMVDEQNGRAIGGDYTEQQARPVGDYRVGMRSLLVRGCLADDDHSCRVNLVDARQRSARQHRIGRHSAIGLDRDRIVAAAKTAIEAGYFPPRNAALPAEKSMSDAAQRRRSDNVQGHSVSRITMSSSAWLPTMK
jgi:hypothetical protein